MTAGRLLCAAWGICLVLLLAGNSALAQNADCRRADGQMAKLDRTLRDALTATTRNKRKRFLAIARGNVRRLNQDCIVPVDPAVGVTITHRYGEIATLKFQAISSLLKALPREGARPTIRQLSGMGTALEQLEYFLSMSSGDMAAIEAMRENLVGRIERLRKPPAGLAPAGTLPPGQILIAQEVAADDDGIVFLQFVLNPREKRASWRSVKGRTVPGNRLSDGYYGVGIEISVPDPAGFVSSHRDALTQWLEQGAALRLGRSKKVTPDNFRGRRTLTGESPCQGIWLQDTGEGSALRLYDLRRSQLIAQWPLDERQLGPKLAGLVRRILALAPAVQWPGLSPEKSFEKRLSLPLVPFLMNAQQLSGLPDKGNIGLVLRYRNPNCAKSNTAISLPHCSAIQLKCAAETGSDAYLVSNGRRILGTESWYAVDWYGNRDIFNRDIGAIRLAATGQSVPSIKTTAGAPKSLPPVEERSIPFPESLPERTDSSPKPRIVPGAKKEKSDQKPENSAPPKKYSLTVNAIPEDAQVRNMSIKPEYEPGMKLRKRVYEIEVSAPGFKTRRSWVLLDEDKEITVELDPIPAEKARTGELAGPGPGGAGSPPKLDKTLELDPTANAPDSADNTGNPHQPWETFQDRLRDEIDGPKMIVIPAGEFLMGSLGGEPGRRSSESPQHPVRIEKPFALGVTEVTFEEYDRFAKATGRKLPNDNGWGRGNRPVIDVSWYDATAYAEWLSDQTGKNYRLPSEAEWEYAARAGTNTAFSTGGCIHTNQASYDGTFDYAGCGANTVGYRRKTVPVGSLLANPLSINSFGLHEMHGNVYEWTADCWHKSYGGAPADGSIWDEDDDGDCSQRVTRGGSWRSHPKLLRSAARHYSKAGATMDDQGFRVARSL